MKYILLYIHLLVLSFLSHAQSFSPQPWANLQAHKRTQNIMIDGNLSDWKGTPAVSLDQPKFFFAGQGMSADRWADVNDLSAKFRVLWDEQYLYVAVEVLDDHVTPAHGAMVADNSTGSWDDDGIEIMVDHDGCAKSQYYIGDSLHHEYHFVYDEQHPWVFDNFWVRDPSADRPMFTLPDGTQEPLAYPGEAMAKNDVTSRFTKSPYQGLFKFRRTAKGYNLELRMKLAGAIMKPANAGGRAMGFDICINDNDEGKGPLKQQLHWSGTHGNFWRDCKFFGMLVLVD